MLKRPEIGTMVRWIGTGWRGRVIRHRLEHPRKVELLLYPMAGQDGSGKWLKRTISIFDLEKISGEEMNLYEFHCKRGHRWTCGFGGAMEPNPKDFCPECLRLNISDKTTYGPTRMIKKEKPLRNIDPKKTPSNLTVEIPAVTNKQDVSKWLMAVYAHSISEGFYIATKMTAIQGHMIMHKAAKESKIVEVVNELNVTRYRWAFGSEIPQPRHTEKLWGKMFTRPEPSPPPPPKPIPLTPDHRQRLDSIEAGVLKLNEHQKTLFDCVSNISRRIDEIEELWK